MAQRMDRIEVGMDLAAEFAGYRSPARGQDGAVAGNDGERAIRGGHGEELRFHCVTFFRAVVLVRADFVRAADWAAAAARQRCMVA